MILNLIDKFPAKVMPYKLSFDELPVSWHTFLCTVGIKLTLWIIN